MYDVCVSVDDFPCFERTYNSGSGTLSNHDIQETLKFGIHAQHLGTERTWIHKTCPNCLQKVLRGIMTRCHLQKLEKNFGAKPSVIFEPSLLGRIRLLFLSKAAAFFRSRGQSEGNVFLVTSWSYLFLCSTRLNNNILVQRRQYVGTNLIMPDKWHTTLNLALNHNLDTHLISYPPFIIFLCNTFWKSPSKLEAISGVHVKNMPNLQLRDSDSTTQIPNSRVFIIRW